MNMALVVHHTRTTPEKKTTSVSIMDAQIEKGEYYLTNTIQKTKEIAQTPTEVVEIQSKQSLWSRLKIKLGFS